MNQGVVEFKSRVPAMSSQAIENVRALEAITKQLPQLEISTHHVLHGGMYARTIMIPAGAVLTGVYIRVQTTLIVNGDASVYLGGEQDAEIRIVGHHVMAASAGRKQAFVAHDDTMLTMVFATNATTIEQAEDEFTDEAHLLMSRQSGHQNTIIITGE